MGYFKQLVVLQLEKIMATVDAMKAELARIGKSTDDIAADLVALMSAVKPSMTEEEVAEVQAGLKAAADKLEGVAAVYPPPVDPA